MTPGESDMKKASSFRDRLFLLMGPGSLAVAAVVPAMAGEWAVALIGVSALVTLLLIWLRFRRLSRTGAAALISGEGSARALLSYWSVPEPWIGIRLLPRLTRASPGVPGAVHIDGDDLVFDKRHDLSSGRNRFAMRVPLSTVRSVTTGPSLVGYGGRSIALELDRNRYVVFNLIMASEKIGDAVAEHIDTKRKSAIHLPEAQISVSADSSRRNRKAVRTPA